MPDRRQDIAIARFAAVSALLARLAAGAELSRALREIASSPPLTLSGTRMRFSPRTLRRWLAAYQAGGLDRLRPESRSLADPSRVLGVDFLAFMATEKKLDPDASIPEILRRAAEARVEVGSRSRVTAWRAARKLGLPIFAEKGPKRADMRRFAYPHRMQMLLTDGVHFRAGATRARRVAMVMLDDATRMALGVVVGTSESSVLFLRLLWLTIQRFGLMSCIYVDNGSGFIGGDVAKVCASLGVALVHGSAGYPEGRGKIERLHQTLRADLLRSFDGSPEISPAPEALRLRLDHYLSEVYGKRPHEALSGKSPMARFLEDELKLRVPDDLVEIRSRFVVALRRKVSRDQVVKVASVPYELPRGYAGTIVTVYRDMLDETVSLMHEGRMIRLSPVDETFNAAAGLGRAAKEIRPGDKRSRPVKSAATRAFDKDFTPIVGEAGDFPEET